MELLLILAVFAALAALQAVLTGWLGLRGFSYERSFSKGEVMPGEQVELVEVIRNRSPLLLPWIRLETRIPPSFGFRTREEVDLRGRHDLKSVFSLLPFSQITRRHRVTLGQRGHFCLTQAAMTQGDLLGIRPVARDVEAPAEIFVYPALLEEGELPIFPSDPQGEVPVARWIQPDPFLIGGIRAYRPGDAERSIHWAATARTGTLQVKVHDFTSDPGLVVLLNGQRREEQWGELSDLEQPIIEYGISLAATLCLQALQQGKEAGFGANLPLDEADYCTFLPPQPGDPQALLRQLACLRIRCLRSFPTYLEELPAITGQDILILSCYDCEALQLQAERLRRMGNTVSFLSLEEVYHG